MAPPNLPFVVQWNLDDTDTNPPWNNTNVNALTTKVQRIEIERNTFRGSLRASTASITVTDEGYHLRPGKASSTYYPNVALGRRIRILAQPSVGVWKPWFFGYIRDVQPEPTDANPPRCTILADGPLAALADLELTLPPSIDPKVYDANDTDHSFLWLVLKAAGLWGTAFVDLDDVGAVVMTGTQGNGTNSFAVWLAQCANAARAIISDEPQYATVAGEPDWKLRWFRPGPSSVATWTWSAPSRQLERMPQVVYNGELPGAA